MAVFQFHPFRHWIVCISVLMGCVESMAAGKADPAAIFEKDIRPLIQKHCVACHGPEKQKGKFRIDTLKAGKEVPVGSQTGRLASSPEGGPQTLTEVPARAEPQADAGGAGEA